MAKKQSWKLLRTKADETADDPDWAGTNTDPGAAICARLDPFAHPSRVTTGIEVVVVAVDATRAPQDRGAGTVGLELIEVVERNIPEFQGSDGDAPAVSDTAVRADVPLNRKEYFDINGTGRFTIRISDDTSLPVGTTDLQVWWREVQR